MHHLPLMLFVLLTTLASAGCYYTVTNEDGTTQRISHREYEELQKNRADPIRR